MPLTDPELRAAEEAWEDEDVAALPGLFDENGLKSARWAFLAGYAAALRASPVGEAEAAVIAAAIAHRERRAREPDWATSEPGDYYNELAALVRATDDAVDALLAIRAEGSEPAGEAVVGSGK